MKYLIQIPQLIFAGAEKVLVSFANDLVARGHEVEILESYERGFLKPQFDPRVTFHAICSKAYTEKYYASLSDILAEKNVARKIKKCGKQVFSKLVGYRRFAEKLASKYYADKEFDVAINYLEIESPEFLLKAIHAKKYLQWYHTDVANLDDPESTDKLIPAFEKMDAIICVAESARKSFVERYPQLSDKTHVIYNYFDEDAIRREASEPFAYDAAGEGRTVLLSVGRMTPQKKYLRFLDVLARLKSEGYRFAWYVLGEGHEKEAILAKIAALQLGDCVHLEGLTDNPYKYMAHCDLFVLPSGWEGFPTVTVEAKIVGCPVLATDVSGIREQLIHGETGWIVDNDENALYEGLKYLLDYPEVREKLQSDAWIERICGNEEKYRKVMELCEEGVMDGKEKNSNFLQ